MKYLALIFLAILPITDLDEIAKVNELKKKAKAAYTSGNFEKAIEHYTYLLDSMEVEDDNITLNLANAYYELKDSAQSVNTYNSLLDSKDGVIKSVAHQQLGIIANRAKAFDEALDHFKQAIKANPKNDEARYNYEMLKKMLDKKKKEEEQKQQNKDQQNKDQKNQDQKKEDQQKKDQEQQKKDQEKQDQEKKDQEQQDKSEQEQQQKDQEQQKDGEEGEEKKEEKKPQPKEGEENQEKEGQEEQMPSLSEKLKDMKISEEKAKMILEALKNNEKQYIQQLKKKPTKRKDPNKPDW